jgi:hypothetical protein
MAYLVNFHLYSQGINIDAYNRKLVGGIWFSGSILADCIIEFVCNRHTVTYKIGCIQKIRISFSCVF